MKKFLKIAIVSTEAQTIISFMKNHIKKLNKKYKIFIYCNNADKLKNIIPKNVVVTNINFQRKSSLIKDLLALFNLVKHFLYIRFDITLSISPKAGFLTSVASYIIKVPNRFHWFTGQFWLNLKGFRKFFYMNIDKITFKLSKHVLVDSHSQRNFLIKNKIISEKNSFVLHKGSVGGVCLGKFKFSNVNRNLIRKKLFITNKDFVFLYLGRINKDKGVPELITAFEKISKKYKKLFLVLVGTIEEENLRVLFKKNKKIIYLSHTDKPEKLLSIADVLCLPSHREGFGSVVIEAAAMKIPALASNIYGIFDAIIPNKTGILHKSRDVCDIQKKLIYCIKNKKHLKIYGENAFKRVKKDFNDNLISIKLLKFLSLQSSN